MEETVNGQGRREGRGAKNFPVTLMDYMMIKMIRVKIIIMQG
jgi:hypothetical protein